MQVRNRTVLILVLMATLFLTCAPAFVRPETAHKKRDKDRQRKIRLHEYRKSTVSFPARWHGLRRAQASASCGIMTDGAERRAY